MQVVVISGLSGSGKSVALNVLEDSGYYVVDNLPATLLPQLVSTLRGGGYRYVAVVADVRSGHDITTLPQQLDIVRQQVDDLRLIYLCAKDSVLMTRFSETRRRHPLANEEVSLEEAIGRERDALSTIARLAHQMDTSGIHPNTLRLWVREFLQLDAGGRINLTFQSFAYKRGVPLDSDLMFDVRCLPNPYYDAKLRPLSGKDEAVTGFLAQTAEAQRMVAEIQRFLEEWLPKYAQDGRNYLTVSLGCTGGQHRSVYMAETLGRIFRNRSLHVLVRHRCLQEQLR